MSFVTQNHHNDDSQSERRKISKKQPKTERKIQAK